MPYPTPIWLSGSFSLHRPSTYASYPPITLINLKHVPYMDSASLGCLIGLHVTCEERKTRYALIGASDRIKTLFRVTQVHNILINFETVEEALTALLPELHQKVLTIETARILEARRPAEPRTKQAT